MDKYGTREVAQAFVEVLFTSDAQREFAKVGFRPLGDLGKEKEFGGKFSPMKQLGRIDEFGGWTQAQTVFEDGGSLANCDRKLPSRDPR